MAESYKNIERKLSAEDILSYPSSKSRVDDLSKISRGKEIGIQLLNACRNGHVQIVKTILETNNIDVNVTLVHTGISQAIGAENNSTYSLLMIAAAYNRIDLVNFILKQPKIRYWANWPCTALYLALHTERNCERINYDMIHNLIAAGASIDQWQTYLSGVSPLLKAWYTCNQKVANTLVFLGANIRTNIRNQNSDHYARETGQIENFPLQAELSRKYLNELSNAYWLGVDVVRFLLPEDIKLKVVDFLFHESVHFTQAFTLGNDLMNGLICKRSQSLQSVSVGSTPQCAIQEQIPQPFTFLKTHQSEIYRQQRVNDDKGTRLSWDRTKACNPGVMDTP